MWVFPSARLSEAGRREISPTGQCPGKSRRWKRESRPRRSLAENRTVFRITVVHHSVAGEANLSGRQQSRHCAQRKGESEFSRGGTTAADRLQTASSLKFTQ